MSFDFENSKTIMNNIYKDIFSLKIFPNRFPSFNDKFRVMTINKKYRVFFVVDEENTTIIVSRIFFSSENYLE
ncbi:MAG: type II toxin-antitoxin system RelE/ParE family toxin [bacterium]|nr:type II toxin-antitoxin system RelE/ParE family toxin [bacterium]